MELDIQTESSDKMSTHSKCKQDQPTYGLALMCNTANEPQRTDLLNAFTAADKLCTQTR